MEQHNMIRVRPDQTKGELEGSESTGPQYNVSVKAPGTWNYDCG